MKCLLCNKEVKSHQSFCLHLRIHKMNIEQYTKQILGISNKCVICGKPTNYVTQYRTFARFCSRKCANNSEESKATRVKLCFERHGVSNPAKLPEVKEKRKQTSIRKYGVTTNLNLPETRKLTINARCNNRDNIIQKAKETNIKRYGVSCTLHSNASIIKKRSTWISKYGTTHPQKSEEVRNKTKQTCIQKYGVDCPFKSEIVKHKTIETNIEKYGVASYMQTPQGISKILGSLFRHKPYILPSGKIISLLGYEPHFLDYIFKNNILQETDIIYSPTRVLYVGFDNKEHYYFPDFYIPKFNLIVEIKSKWTEKQDKNLLLKEAACLQQGFDYIRITNDNFDAFTVYIQAKA